MKVYISGPLFTECERNTLEKIDRLCTSLGFQTALPHRDVGFSTDRKRIFERDLALLDGCDTVVAILNGKDVDSGTAWEIGYAYSKGKKIFGIFDDLRIYEPHMQINLMVYYGVEITHSIVDLRNKLREHLKKAN